ncbi:MAG TPA: EAL domain-containing protein [Geodermatophilus sp.]|nr:EAL domain-containing protein [Geodermatophilus sp.]
MKWRAGWVLAGAVLAFLGCAVAALDPGLRPLGEAVVSAVGLAVAVVLWSVGSRQQRGLRGWRLFALGPVFPVAGAVLAAVAGPDDPLQASVLRWVPTVPGYLVAIAAILTLVDRHRLRRGGARVAVELALFLIACLVTVQLLVVGPHGSWAALAPQERLILGAAVLVTSATMAAALTVLGVIETRRRCTAWVLLGGTVLLTVGRALGTSATAPGEAGGRFFVVGGLLLLVTAALADPGPCPEPGARPRTGRATMLRDLLPHGAMLLAVTVAGLITLTGRRPDAVTVAGAVVCVALACAHRWVAARDEQRLGARLRRSEAYFRSLVRSSGDAVLILDDALRISWASPTLDRTLGTAAHGVVGRELLEVAHGEDAVPLAAALLTGDGAPSAGLVPLRLRHADGSWRFLEASVSDLRHDADVGAIVLHCRDMTERRARERALEEVAFTDPLTGLPNRAGCVRRLQEALDAAGGGPCAALLVIELEGLDAVREHAGRDVVSAVLVELGRRLRGTVRGSELVARLGGGAFAVLAEGAGSAADLLADRCLAAVEQPIETAAGIFDLSANVGVAELVAGQSVADLLGRAELAVSDARRSGPGTATRYRPALGAAAERRAQLRDALPGASARGELSVLFQPIVSLGEQRITGIEALLRWRHPTLGDVPPAEFVPIAERAGVIGELQRWALEQAAQVAVALPGSGVPLRLGVNISASHVAARTLVGDVAAVLDCTGLAPERLVLEITEATVLADGDHVAVDFEALRLMGVHVALDDFGTGHSSLAHLTRLPIDILKLDRSFVSRVDRDPQSRALCESVVGIGRALGLDVVAEGVETPAQLGALRGLGCGFAQGFLLARPLTVAQLSDLLRDGAGALWPGLVGSR